jgi:hypothetical protein
MKRRADRRKDRRRPKTVLRLPDLEHAKIAVLNSLSSLEAQRCSSGLRAEKEGSRRPEAARP